ncbi:hypothetical protein COV18_00745 [Candidatus Woesearchaeota archaeon CG10_big_fil_rev_8_21_14_0_10_37_12]|nr:MAG: hypothetical protein COV18_00745 [Candidatus Woesearchaeota archaeon CG10_big_fil_rev_8_21_14_0_10_37_12]
MIKHLLKIKPKQYLQQRFGYCGCYTIKAILSAFGKDSKKPPKKYHPYNWKRFGRMLPKDMIFTLEKYGFNARIKSANDLSNKQKIEALKQELRKNKPVILLVGNGYFWSGKYSPLRRFFISHWISLWGFDDEKKIVYVYDSILSPEGAKKLPIGNTTRTYKEILRDWKGVFYCPKYLYIVLLTKEYFIIPTSISKLA